MNQVTERSQARPVSMAEQWFQFATPEHFWMDWRFRVFANQRELLPSNGAKLLEIGCGSGQFLRQLAALRKDYGLDGCDLDKQALSLADHKTANVFVYDICERHSELEAAYDALFLMDVIEHIDDDVDFLRSAAFHAKPGASIFINVPASMMLFSRYDEVAGHKRRYDKQMLERLFLEAGLEMVRLCPWGLSLVPIALVRKWLLRNVRPEDVIKTGFVPSGILANAFLQTLKSIETSLPFRPPCGTSILAVARKR